MTSPHAAPQRLIELDALRGIAILLVLDYHFRKYGIFFEPLQALGIQNFGWVGVDIFFVLSGFLIGGLLFQEWKIRNSIRGVRFLARRAFKIWPAYYFYILVEVLVRRHPLHTFLLGNLLNIQNYTGTSLGHTWSLAVEEQFYLALTAALTWAAWKHADAHRVLIALSTTAFGITVLRCGLMLHDFHVFGYTHTRMDALLFGVILAHLLHFSPRRFDWIQRRKAALAAILLACFFVLCWDNWTHPHFVDIIAADAGSVALLLLMYRRASVPHSLFYRWLARIGVYSYGIYLWHISVFAPCRWISAKLPGALGLWSYHLLPYISAILLGVLATKLVEFPFLRLRERWIPPDRAFEPKAESDPQRYAAAG